MQEIVCVGMDECARVSSALCSQCCGRITSTDEQVLCFGSCKKAFHISCLSHAVGQNYDLIRKIKNFVFVCDECLDNSKVDCDINNLVGMINHINDKIDNMNKQMIVSSDLKKQIQNIVRDEMKPFSGSASNDKGEVARYALRSNSKKRKLSDNEKTPTLTYARVVKTTQTPVVSNVLSKQVAYDKNSTKRDIVAKNDKIQNASLAKLEETVRLKPIKEQSVDVTRKDLKSSLDPVSLGVTSVRYIESTAEVLVRCASKEKAQNFMTHALKVLGKRYSIEIKQPAKPKIKVVGFAEEDKFDDGKFVELFKKQNSLNDSVIKVVHIEKNKKWKHNPMIATVEVDSETFSALINRGKVNIGWERCKIFEDINVLRCYKCWNYGHKAEFCRESTRCAKCGEGHDTKECSAQFEKCINCINFNSTVKLDLQKQVDICLPA